MSGIDNAARKSRVPVHAVHEGCAMDVMTAVTIGQRPYVADGLAIYEACGILDSQ